MNPTAEFLEGPPAAGGGPPTPTCVLQRSRAVINVDNTKVRRRPDFYLNAGGGLGTGGALRLPIDL